MMINININIFLNNPCYPTLEGLTNDIPLSVGTLVTLKNPSAGKFISRILALLDVTQKLLSEIWELLKQSTRPSEQSVPYVIVIISGDKI